MKQNIAKAALWLMLLSIPAYAINNDLPLGAKIGLNSSGTLTALVASLNNKLSDFASTTSAQLRSIISDASGTGSLIFGTNPTITNPTIIGTITGSITGNAGTATALQNARTINGVSFDGTGNIVVPAAAGTLTGSTLASGVTTSSLTSVGTLGGLTVTSPITGSISGNAGTATALATAGTATTVLHGNASGAPSYASLALGDMATNTANTLLGFNNSGAAADVAIGSGCSLSGGTLSCNGGGSGGTVTTTSVVSANGFGGTVANPTTTPAITLTTSVNGILLGNGSAVTAVTAGTNYSAGTAGLATGILKSTTSTGALTIAAAGDFPTLNQNTTGSAATLTTARAINGVNFDGSA